MNEWLVLSFILNKRSFKLVDRCALTRFLVSEGGVSSKTLLQKHWRPLSKMPNVAEQKA